MAGAARGRHGGSIRKLTSDRWQVRIYDRATGQHVSVGTFAAKQDANVALAQAVADQSRGAWVPPARGRVTLADYAGQWVDQHASLAPRTRERYESVLRLHVAPHIGSAAVGDLTTASIRRWHSKLAEARSPGTAAKAYRFVRAVLNGAVEDGLITANPCRIKGAGVERSVERPIATVAEVDALAEAVGPRFRMLVLLATWTSLRLGELAALTRADIDLLHGTVSVTKNRQRLDDGTTIVTVPKSAAGYRKVTIPPPLVPQLAEHLAHYAEPGPDALVFRGELGAPLERSRWGKVWRTAARKVGRPDLRFHDLRHTGNTLAAATGASTKELMVRMGHASPRAALIYQHATRERDEAIARALGELMTPSPVIALDGYRHG